MRCTGRGGVDSIRQRLRNHTTGDTALRSFRLKCCCSTNTKEVFIKTDGGKIGDSEVFVEPGFRFRISDEMLACLHNEGNNTYTIFLYGLPPDTGGVLWYNGPGEHPPDIQKTIGRVINIMLANNIPIALPEKDRPPMPGGGSVTPPLK